MRTRQEYDQAFEVVRTALASWDPCGLLGGGAPADEWDGEIAALLPKIRSAQDSADVARELREVFGRSLGSPPVSADEYNAAAEDIFLRLLTAGLLG